MSILNYIRLKVFPPEKKPPAKNHMDLYLDPDAEGVVVLENSDGVKVPLITAVEVEALENRIDEVEETLEDSLSGTLVVLDGDSLACDRYNTSGATAVGTEVNPKHWVSQLRGMLIPHGGEVVSKGVPSDTSAMVLARIATTLATSPSPANFKRSIYAIFAGTNDFEGIPNATTLANVEATCAIARTAGYSEIVVICPAQRSPYPLSQTYPALIRAETFYDTLVDMGTSTRSYRTFDAIHFSESGSRIMARRFMRDVLERVPLEPVLGRDGWFASVTDVLAYYAEYGLPTPIYIRVTGTNSIVNDSSVTMDSEIPITASLTVDIESGASWATYSQVLAPTDLSAISIFRVTGNGTWNMEYLGGATPNYSFGLNSPASVHVDVGEVAANPGNACIRVREARLLWEPRRMVITSNSTDGIFLSYGPGVEHIAIRNSTIVLQGTASLLNGLDGVSADQFIIQNSTLILPNGQTTRANTSGSSFVRWLGDNYVSDNTLHSGDTEDVTQGSIEVLTDSTITAMGLRNI